MNAKRFNIISIMIAIITSLVMAGGCASGTPGTSPASTPPSTTSAGPAYGSFASQGQTIFSSKCAQCHGANGQGSTAPALIGTNANLGKYNNAKKLLDFISTAMPLNAPGSLSHQDYLNVLCYLLVQNNDINATAQFDESTLTSVQVK